MCSKKNASESWLEILKLVYIRDDKAANSRFIRTKSVIFQLKCSSVDAFRSIQEIEIWAAAAVSQESCPKQRESPTLKSSKGNINIACLAFLPFKIRLFSNMKCLMTLLLSLLLMTCRQQAFATSPPPTPQDLTPAVGPQSAPEPVLLSPETYEEYVEYVEDMDSYPEQYIKTRFQARIITLNQDNEPKSTTNKDGEQPQQQHIEGVSGLGIQYGWTKHQWVRNIDNEARIDEVYNREIVVGVPLLLIAVSTVLSVALLIIEIYERVGYNNAEKKYYGYSALGDC